MEKMKIFNIIIYTLFIFSIVTNMFLVISIGGISIIHEEDLIINDIQWCENTNDWIDLTNDLILELQYSNDAYLDIDYVEHIDCWGDEDDIEY